MTTIQVKVYDGVTPVAELQRFEISDEVSRLIRDDQVLEFPRELLRASPRIGSSDRFIRLPNGWQLGCANNHLLDQLPSSEPTESVAAWLDARLWAAMIALLTSIAIICLAYVVAMPMVARIAAALVPARVELSLGESALEAFDEADLLSKSTLPASSMRVALDGLEQIRELKPSLHIERIEFRASDELGPNAFALPGGILLVTDDMIRTCGSAEEIEAVLAHEAGHVEGRHFLRTTMQSIGVAAISSVLFGDISSVISLSSISAVLEGARFSRGLEEEADEYALNYLTQRGLSTEFFAKALERIDDKSSKKEGAQWSWLASHPDTTRRIMRARRYGR